ncbi:MAG: hypothetical protein JST20_00150 [Bacteroidetes bacterium]|nr:hypothetical protein [Bacteroidota bacterium]
MTPILTHKQVEEMLPDYAFGRLNAEDSIEFERSISVYPDLSQELQDIHSVFSKVEQMDFNSILENRTRNISVRVRERLAVNNTRNNTIFKTFRLIIPTLGLAAMALFFFTSENSPFNSIRSKSLSTTNIRPIQVVSTSDVASIFSDDINEGALLAESRVHQNNSVIAFPSQVSTTLDELIADNLSISTDDSDNDNTTQKDINLDNLNDSEIQNLLNELNYENPSNL